MLLDVSIQKHRKYSVMPKEYLYSEHENGNLGDALNNNLKHFEEISAVMETEEFESVKVEFSITVDGGNYACSSVEIGSRAKAENIRVLNKGLSECWLKFHRDVLGQE